MPAERRDVLGRTTAHHQTALVGKYHLGNNPSGFDYYDIFPGQGRHRDPQMVSKEGTKLHRGHSSDIIADLGLAWLEKRDRERPFLLCLHDKATHMPWQSAERFRSLFAQHTFAEPPTLLDDYRGRADVLQWTLCRVSQLNRWQKTLWGEPPPGSTAEQETRWLYQQYMQHYLRTAAGLDENIGRVLDYLDRQGLTGDTVVVYADATIALPLLTAHALAHRPPRPLRRLYDRREKLVDRLRKDYKRRLEA